MAPVQPQALDEFPETGHLMFFRRAPRLKASVQLRDPVDLTLKSQWCLGRKKVWTDGGPRINFLYIHSTFILHSYISLHSYMCHMMLYVIGYM